MPEKGLMFHREAVIWMWAGSLLMFRGQESNSRTVIGDRIVLRARPESGYDIGIRTQSPVQSDDNVSRRTGMI